VKARNTLSATLIFTFLACTEWLEIWLVSWCLFLSEVWRYFFFVIVVADQNCKEQRRLIDLMLCISRRMSALLTSVLLPSGSLCTVITVSHDCSFCDFLVRRLPVTGCNCSKFGTLLSFVSLGTHDGDVHSLTTGSEDAACSTPRRGQYANCSILYALLEICKIRFL
jgi:hypothetical protein